MALTFTLIIPLNPKLSLAEKRIGVEAAALLRLAPTRWKSSDERGEDEEC